MDAAEQDRERVGALGHHDEVYVIGHQAVRQDADTGVGLVSGDQTQVSVAVRMRVKDRLMVRPALGYMVGQSW